MTKTNFLLLSFQSLLYGIISSLQSATIDAASSSSARPRNSNSNTASVRELIPKVVAVAAPVGCFFPFVSVILIKNLCAVNSLIAFNAGVHYQRGTNAWK